MGREILAQGMAFQNKASNKQWEGMSVQEKHPQSTQKKAGYAALLWTETKTHQTSSISHLHQSETQGVADFIWELTQEQQKHKWV